MSDHAHDRHGLMSVSPYAAAEVEVVSLNPARPVVPVPLINDIVRTRYVIPGSVFLVESIEPRLQVARRYRAVRVLLGDGELCIQALLRSEIHGFVDGGQIYEGCYVRVDEVEFQSEDLSGPVLDKPDDGLGDPATAERRKKDKPRKLVYLVVGDMITVGWNNAYLKILGLNGPPANSRPASAVRQGVTMGLGKFAAQKLEVGSKLLPVQDSEDIEDFSDSDDDAFETLAVSEEKAFQRRIQPPGDSRQHAAIPTTKFQGNKPWMANDPTKPLKLTNLRSIPNLPYKQNWMVNVLAVVASLSDVEPSHLPPTHSQRTARLADPSTSKQVHLTVFLDPEQFVPEVGSVVLLVGVKNHRFDGGSLKKYASDRLNNGANWWHGNPEALGWCEAEVSRLRLWWSQQTAQQQQPCY
ncbi:hypothetical protein B0H63DRAFT_509516 [Podospora didyma]|uniref:Uncharacterized protein n=1 Tax=Podospora didyma TaxID=330526 RepID=A0AAE0NU95_9PEZI|nr:hypothetical protein B0H63DRAFT_509516 [Podospora didyma]